MSYKIESSWITVECYQACVIKTSMGHRCGYVGLDYFHPLAHVHYQSFLSSIIRVHGGLTYCSDEKEYSRAIIFKEKLTYPMETERNLWWFGFDTNHLGDKNVLLINCISECNSLSEQLNKLANYINAYRSE